MVSGDTKKAVLGPRKISETLLEFAVPLTACLEDPTPAEMQSVLELAAEIWNSASPADALSNLTAPLRLRPIATALAQDLDLRESEASDLVARLVKARRTRYAAIRFAFGPVSVVDEGNREFYVMASAGAYEELKSPPSDSNRQA